MIQDWWLTPGTVFDPWYLSNLDTPQNFIFVDLPLSILNGGSIDCLNQRPNKGSRFTSWCTRRAMLWPLNLSSNSHGIIGSGSRDEYELSPYEGPVS